MRLILRTLSVPGDSMGGRSRLSVNLPGDNAGGDYAGADSVDADGLEVAAGMRDVCRDVLHCDARPSKSVGAAPLTADGNFWHGRRMQA